MQDDDLQQVIAALKYQVEKQGSVIVELHATVHILTVFLTNSDLKASFASFLETVLSADTDEPKVYVASQILEALQQPSGKNRKNPLGDQNIITFPNPTNHDDP